MIAGASAISYVVELLDPATGREIWRTPRTEPFNWAAINNHAAEAARGEHLLFLNADIEGTSDGWLEALVEQSQAA